MWQAVSLLLVVGIVNAKPGIFGEHFDASLFASAPVLPAPTFFKEPIFAPAPIVASAPIIKTIAPAPIIKAVAPLPIVKAVAPATSYATVTQFHVTHPVVKLYICLYMFYIDNTVKGVGNPLVIKNARIVCTSEECLRSAANLKLSMDFNADPCDDFYQYVCGNWKQEHINHGWYSRFSSFETINERIAVSTMDFLKSNSTKGEPLPVTQSRDLYKSCMDVGKSRNSSPLPRYTFSLIVLFTIVISFPLSPFTFKKYVDKKTTRRKRVKLELDEEELFESAYKRVVVTVMKAIISNVTKVPSEKVLVEASNIIWNITDDISELAGDDDDEFDEDFDDLDVRTIKASELQNLTDFLMKENNLKPKEVWKTYFNMLFQDIENVTLDLDGKDLIRYLPNDLDYINSIVVYLAKKRSIYLELYAWYHTVYSMIVSTTTEISEYIYKESAPFKKNSILRSRSMDCADLVIEFMGIAVSYGIADKSFLTVTKPKVDEMLINIKDAFVQRVKTLKWMDEKTKNATLEKSEEMVSFIGFPEWLLNKSALEYYYAGITIANDTFLENMLSIIEQYTPYRLANLREINPRTWRTDPTTVNAYNYFGDNSINVPMAILSFPIYHLGLEVLNYGAIGSVLGHELTHGFDNTGRKFDKYGNYIQWWSNDTIETFEKKTECFVAQYENFSLPNINATVNGKMTLGENLADNGGLHHAFLAYKNYQNLHGTEPQLPGFEKFNDEQIFFIAFGSIWCESRSDESLKSQLKHDEHCPNPIRVAGTLQNSDDFSKAFNCSMGSKMNPKKNKCRIW
ncbi:zinc metalloprotease family m13 neprilysin-related [Holotrichia oblita]|uniref:Zinc metalloprotease family m13 neprilysin-related n=1 Tax=Holotrichia oblita TaxID=644536 RepID=A0ACB9TA59_HOLOL|nr:zinc metalloprotease family m13 neprilysin-related [Holotrichia oblita]